MRREGLLARFGEALGHRQGRRGEPTPPLGREGHLREEALELGARQGEPLEGLPFVPLAHAHSLTEHLHLRGRHHARMIVLVPRERQAEALDRVGDEDDGAVVVDALEGFEQGRQIVAGEVGHQPRELVVGAAVDQRRDGALVADVVEETLAPGGAALEGQRGIELVRAGVDPFPQPLAALLAEGRLEQHAVFERHHLPAEGAEDRLEARVEPLADHRVEALAIVVDDPPGVADALLPALEQRLEDVALVHLGIADEGDHAALRTLRRPAVRLHVILHEAREQRLRDAEPHRAGREIDVVAVLGARGIGLRALVAAEALELVARLVAEQVLDGVEGGARMRLDGDAILRAQGGEIERGHDRRERGRGGLVPADLQAVDALAQVVGVVDRPRGQPQDLALERGEEGQAGVVRTPGGCLGHACSVRGAGRP